MALTGHLSDLSLSELIEFFCNQRKTGRLKVLYPRGPGYFYLQTGSVVNARIGVLRGIEAVYYALTLPNAEFRFHASAEAPERNINQPWAQVVLEGLRRLDEGIAPSPAFPEGFVDEDDEVDSHQDNPAPSESNSQFHAPSFLSTVSSPAVGRKEIMLGGAVAAALVVAAIGVPAGLYKWSHASVTASRPANIPSESPRTQASESVSQPEAATSESGAKTLAETRLVARRQKGRVKAREAAAVASARATTSPASASSAIDSLAKSGPKRVTVQVTYDESGRVTQASGGDPNALRIARQKRFPPGKAGSTTVTIPIK